MARASAAWSEGSQPADGRKCQSFAAATGEEIAILWLDYRRVSKVSRRSMTLSDTLVTSLSALWDQKLIVSNELFDLIDDQSATRSVKMATIVAVPPIERIGVLPFVSSTISFCAERISLAPIASVPQMVA